MSNSLTVAELADEARAAACALAGQSHSFYELEEQQRKVRERIEEILRTVEASTLCARDTAVCLEIQRMRDRLETLRRLSNMQEVGGFTIQCGRLAGAVFEALN